MKSYRVWAATLPDSYWTLADSEGDAIGQVAAALRIPTFDLKAEESANPGAPEGAILISESGKAASQAPENDAVK